MIGYRSVLSSGGTDVDDCVTVEGDHIRFTGATFANATKITIGKNIKNCAYMFNNVAGLNNVPVIIHANVTNCYFMFRGLASNANIYININPSQTTHYFTNMLYSKGNAYRTRIFCNNLSYLNKTTATTSIVGKAITWTSTTTGYYNSTYNIYLYNNYNGST